MTYKEPNESELELCLHREDQNSGLAAEGAQLLTGFRAFGGGGGRHWELSAAPKAEERLCGREKGKDSVGCAAVCGR
jgi:hypothetical protein